MLWWLGLRGHIFLGFFLPFRDQTIMQLRINPGNKKAWGILIVVFSIPSVITGGGFIIGFIVGIVGGFLALRKIRRSTENSKWTVSFCFITSILRKER